MSIDRRPTYHHGSIIPLAVARWFFVNPVDRISIVPAEERKPGSCPSLLRFHSGAKHIDHHVSWGICLTSGKDRQGRESLVDLEYHEEMAEIVAWEARRDLVGHLA